MATDQEIRDAGFKYIPQQQYLQNPFELPAADPVTDQGIVATNAFTGSGGDGFSVYNPNPNSIVNRDYRPNYEYRQFVDGYDPNLSATMNMKMMEVDPNYKGADYYNKPPSKMDGLMSMLPYVGSLTKGVKFLGDQISPFLPVNRRSVLENELGGQGIMVNDIGQIVAANQGSAYDPSGSNIMAGYNANKVTQETFDKRRAKAKDKMSEEGFKKFNAALTAAEEKFFGAKDQTDKIYDFEEDEKNKKKKNTIINRFITKKKAAETAGTTDTDTGTDTGTIVPPYVPDGTPGGGAGQGIDISNAGTIRSSDNNFQGDSGPTTQQESDYGYGSDFGFAKGGRTGYFYGGRVNFKNGGLASLL